MNPKEQQDKEYRAQWIRDCTRELLLASLAAGFVAGHGVDLPARCHSLAASLWERYEQERK